MNAERGTGEERRESTGRLFLRVEVGRKRMRYTGVIQLSDRNLGTRPMVQATVQSTEYKYITLGDRGIPQIAGTTMKVVELVTAHLTYSWSPAELHSQYPHITLSQIYSALSYYWDHQAEIDADIDRRLTLAKQQQEVAAPSPMLTRLKAQGLLR
jgi:uncharacterized protein (DUF433 family)